MEVHPSYNTDNPDMGSQPPTRYTFPENFEIGSLRTTAPLVTTKQVKNHLTLLHVFANLRSQVNSIRVNTQQAVPFPPENIEKRWCWFVAMAVERFSIWCATLNSDDSRRNASELLPPLDVIMVSTRFPANANSSPLIYASDLGDILTSEPSKARMDFWFARTGRLFDPLEDTKVNHSRPVICPYCKYLTTTPYVTASGTGFVQKNFVVECANPGCRIRITKSSLAARKLLEDLAKKVADGKEAASLPGTLRTNHNPADTSRAKSIRDVVFKATIFAQRPSSKKGPHAMEQWILLVLQVAASDFYRLWSDVVLALSKNTKGKMLMPRIRSAYESPYMFSVELVGAVIRQGSFVTKMHDLQWTQPGFFDSEVDKVALQHAIARYHGFLDLMTEAPGSLHVPTLDIDLAWHTHQLMGETYNNDCMTYVRRYIDHDDRVEEHALSNAFEMTCRAWKDRFGMPYTHCGCPLPKATLGDRLSRRFLPLTIKQERAYLPVCEDLGGATHPSDHNAVFLWPFRTAGLRKQAYRRAKISQGKQREAKQRLKGHLPPLTPNEMRYLDVHTAAFFIPLPLTFGFENVPGGCATYAGNIVDITNASGMATCAMLGTCATTTGGGGASRQHEETIWWKIRTNGLPHRFR
ncbi:hypothetical protein H0H93_009050 [Arthromyces matolae]|nr:hypothetical protein H0H93_009050 [Arthromyces matolae]